MDKEKEKIIEKIKAMSGGDPDKVLMFINSFYLLAIENRQKPIEYVNVRQGSS